MEKSITTSNHRTLCGKIDQSLLHKKVTLRGWVNRRRDHGGLIFIDLRDRSGIMQLVFSSNFSKLAHNIAHALRSEFVIEVQGTIVKRAPDTVNELLKTGKWELQVDMLRVLNKAKQLPFTPDEAENVDEEMRLTYRYLDLRRPTMQAHIALRSTVSFLMRQFFINKGFYEVETPLLTKNTPEGAREFLVPSRMHPGRFYALPQSPQLYKQLLMASGVERYFQFARCFRDEDLRSDRQLEFTQLDLEMSFVDETDIQHIVEDMLKFIWHKIFDVILPTPFARITYDEAIMRYGSDKPDMRFGLLLHDCTSLFAETELRFIKKIIDKGGRVGGIHVSDYSFSRSELDSMVELAQQMGAQGLLWIRVKDGVIESPVAKFLPNNFFQQLKIFFPDVTSNSVLFVMAGEFKKIWMLLGRVRTQLAHKLDLISKDIFSFVWVTDFPLFTYNDELKKWEATHHPFTAPVDGWEDVKLGLVKSQAYDIVLNGMELGGGSIRIHDAITQKKIFNLLGLNQEEIQEKFGFLLEAQELGFPPHGGIALGFDRLIMLMSRGSSIREVIAFPKTARGYDLMMTAPTQVEDSELDIYKLRLNLEKK